MILELQSNILYQHSIKNKIRYSDNLNGTIP